MSMKLKKLLLFLKNENKKTEVFSIHFHGEK